MLNQGKMLVMLDEFDEVPKAKRPLVVRWLNAQMRTYKNSAFILTSRPKAYTEQDPGDRLDYNTLLWVRNFNSEQGHLPFFVVLCGRWGGRMGSFWIDGCWETVGGYSPCDRFSSLVQRLVNCNTEQP
jgi:hypothetical protein